MGSLLDDEYLAAYLEQTLLSFKLIQ